MRFAYADPPYPKLSKKYYGSHPAFGGEVDHRALIERLVEEFPQGWALSTNAPSLQPLLKICPNGVRTCIWVKGSRRGVAFRARNAYEPVLVWGGRPRRLEIDEELDDTLIWGGRQHSHPGALVGMKPAAFSEWLFRQLGAAQGDELHDLFPGSGAIGRAWALYIGGPVVQPSLVDERPVEKERAPSRLQEAADAMPERLTPQQRLRLV